ncbi:hypothetical protein FE257_003678 [Aspergillus nanangensis]|uniref:Heterokaryon incompatibility domain-containing protein n=1 Tax=Aspergillus nanangensis TaxID=2582783 RepID=A0AAD4CSA9_ASPNN|nr:hypothetical protein FE257_003678 [Aspergillus nanangensis]
MSSTTDEDLPIQEEPDWSSEDDQYVWFEGKKTTYAWHDPSCSMPRIYSYNSMTTCLNCYCYDADAAVLDTPYSTFNRITQKTELRLLLIKGASFDEDVYCRLIPTEIARLPAYEAISYTWAEESGDARKVDTIYINGRPFTVTTNCKTALKRVRLPSRARTVWIDAVCIDQTNDEERSQQVQLMPEIYSRAKRVLIYLGEAMHEELPGLAYISRGPTSHLRDDELWPVVRQTIASLLRRRYFSRVWILQEVALAQEALVLCGEHEIPWESLRGMVDSFPRMKSTSLPQAMALFDESHPLPKALEFGARVYRGASHLLNLLDLTRGCQSTDPRDKVFAVFGMINCAESLGYIADYTKDVEQTYSRIALFLAEAAGLVPILARAVCRRNIQTLPLWVTDWSSPYSPDELRWINQVHGESDSTIRVDKDRCHIEFAGARICHVETLLRAGYLVEVSLAGEGQSGQILIETTLELQYLHQRLRLPPDERLFIYAILQSPRRRAWSYMDHYMDESEEELVRPPEQPVKKRSIVKVGTKPFILSTGGVFCFRGLCVLRPMNRGLRLGHVPEGRKGKPVGTGLQERRDFVEGRRQELEKWRQQLLEEVLVGKEQVLQERWKVLERMSERIPEGCSIRNSLNEVLTQWNDWKVLVEQTKTTMTLKEMLIAQRWPEEWKNAKIGYKVLQRPLENIRKDILDKWEGLQVRWTTLEKSLDDWNRGNYDDEAREEMWRCPQELSISTLEPARIQLPDEWKRLEERRNVLEQLEEETIEPEQLQLTGNPWQPWRIRVT